MSQILLITVAGRDQPGITAQLAGVLADHDANVLDISQAVVHRQLVLGVMFEVPAASSEVVTKAMCGTATELGLTANVRPITVADYEQWVDRQGKPRYIVTLLARKISAAHMAAVASLVADNGLNIDGLQRLSGRVPLSNGDTSVEARRSCVEFSVRGEPRDVEGMRAEFMRLAHEQAVDVAFQRESPFRRNRRLICFDMDSTLIEQEVIDELAKVAGVGDEVAAITERAMNGELDFGASFTARVALLAGLPETALAEVAARLKLTEGAERLIGTLRSLGYRTAILSGGFTYFARHLQERLGIDHVYANELEIRDGVVTGNVVGQVVDGARKAELLRELAAREGVDVEQVIAVGDGANDLPMLNLAGLGIAFRAKPLVQRSAEHSLSTLGLDGVLYLLGVRDRDLEAPAS